MSVDQAEIRALILERVRPQLEAKSLAPDEVPDDFDLLLEGVIDSFGLVELVGALEERVGRELPLDDIDADDFTKIGPLARFVSAQAVA